MIGDGQAVGTGPTVEARSMGWALPVLGLPSDSVPHAAEKFIGAVLDITSSVSPRELLEVSRIDGDPAVVR